MTRKFLFVKMRKKTAKRPDEMEGERILASMDYKYVKKMKDIISEHRLNQALFFLIILFLVINGGYPWLRMGLESLIFSVGIISIILYRKNALLYNLTSPFPAVAIAYFFVKSNGAETRLTPIFILFFLGYIFLYSFLYSIYSICIILYVTIERLREEMIFKKLTRKTINLLSPVFGIPLVHKKKDILFPSLYLILISSSSLLGFSESFGSETLKFKYIAYLVLISIFVIMGYDLYTMSTGLWSFVSPFGLPPGAGVLNNMNMFSFLIWIIALEIYFFESNLLKVIVPLIIFCFFFHNLLRYILFYYEKYSNLCSSVFFLLLLVISKISFELINKKSPEDWILSFSILILLSLTTLKFLFVTRSWKLQVRRNIAFFGWIIVPVWIMIAMCTFSYHAVEPLDIFISKSVYNEVNSLLSTIIQSLTTVVAVIGGFTAGGMWYIIHSEKKVSSEHTKYFVSSVLAFWTVFAFHCIRTINRTFDTMAKFYQLDPNLESEIGTLIRQTQANFILLIAFLVLTIIIYYLSKYSSEITERFFV